MRVRSRHVDLWLDHKNFGQVWMGHGSIAGDAAGLFSVTGTGHVFGSGTTHAADGVSAAKSSVGIAGGSAAGKSRGTKSFAFFGARENRIMYVTPSLMGGRLRVSYGENKSYSVGLRYFGAPPGVKSFSSAFAAGYRYDPNEATGMARTAFAVSGGVKHSSGFNVSGGYESSRTKGSSAKPYDWFAEGGWTGKVSDMGATSLGVGYGASSDGMHGSAQQYWIAVNQKVDAAAADVYAGVAFDSGSVTHTVAHTPGVVAVSATPGSDGITAVEGNDNYVTLGAATTNVDAVEAANAMPDEGCGGARTVASGANLDQTTPDAFPANGTQCSVDRDGVVIFLVGVRIKF